MDDDLHAHALERSRRRLAYAIRPIRKEDNLAVARLIRAVMPEFGASGPGFAILDPEVDDMFSSYGSYGERAAYFVVAHESGDIVGGGGFAPLAGGEEGTCELRKMYFVADVRGLGFGRDLLETCLACARNAGFARMYLETLSAMKKARDLYERNGFRKLEAQLGDTGHYGCNAYYLKDLT